MTSNNFDWQRLKDLEDNLAKEQELLKQFEDAYRYENDPRIKARYQQDIERQKQAIDRYQKEYQELKDKLSGNLSSQINHVSSDNPSLNSNNSQQSIFSNVNVGGNLNVGNISQVSNSGTTPQPNPENVNVDNRTININQGNYNENIKGDYIQQNNPGTMTNSSNQNPSQKRTILVLAASPTDMPGLRLDEEIREIDEGLRLAKQRDNFKLEQRLAARTEDLRRALLQYEPQIVHFCGHGETDGIFLENDAGTKQLVPKEALTNLFKLFSKKGVQCVVLNACYSEEQAKEISEHIDFVVGMNIAVGDKAAIQFAVGFYDALGAGWSYDEAYELGCNAIALEGIPEELTPVLKKKITDSISHQSNLSSSNSVKANLSIEFIPISESSPMLLGIAIDVSGSMQTSIQNQSSQEENRLESVLEGLRNLSQLSQEKIVESGEPNSIGKLIKAFAYGFGFSDRASQYGDVIDIARKFISIPSFSSPQTAAVGDVRNLLEVAQIEPTTIFLEDVYKRWEEIKSGIWEHRIDLFGSTPMRKAMETIKSRFAQEINSYPGTPHSLLLLVSDGESNDGSPIRVCEEIKNRGTIIMSCFLTSEDVIEPKKLYSQVQADWSEGAKNLFECSSSINEGSLILPILSREPWKANPGDRLFVQVNQSSHISDFIGLISKFVSN